MKLKIPPVIVFLCFGLMMYLLAKILPFGYFDFFGRNYLLLGLLIAAFLVVLVALFQFQNSKTTVDPINPSKASHLVDSGIYAFSRNPMYLAMLMILLAWGLWLGNAFNTLLAAAFVAYMNRFQIVPEEEALETIFGKEFRQYCIKTRRWF
ncbi:isoprenylcysteine carboxylmethyltransferase family protein [Euzebyella marina]|uniref:Isoprenylcysteine carboxylmethyltransferase family protein n=1 Tax=Euzebyella marina TaxID=1761453 RepID=A0A3G2L6E9_9FLAO|nr:isoprenylcysteine carboxylmethyltransferase family protein [Euzebyella marina]AYN67835.1 isoprenylcysteine carboxylmethyltransferase family protein [Euzebyella marina]